MNQNTPIEIDSTYFIFFENGPTRPLYVQFRSFQIQFYRKFVDFSRIRTQIVRIEGKHANHSTTTTTARIDIFQVDLHAIKLFLPSPLLLLSLLMDSMTRCWSKKQHNFLQNLPKKYPHQFNVNSANFTLAQNYCLIFGLVLQGTLFPRTFKITPIWSHCSWTTSEELNIE